MNKQFDRTLDSLLDERSQPFSSKDLTKLVSPGSYPLTADQGDQKLSGSNTKYLFKNLFGETVLTFLFFSNKYIYNIQSIIKSIIYKDMGYIVDNQSNNELLIIMRSTFLQYNNHPKLLTDNMSDSERNILFKEYTNEFARLNKLLIDEIIPMIKTQIQMYIGYLKDTNTRPVKKDNPVNTNIKGERQYRSITEVLGGAF